MKKTGEILKKAREEKGLSLHEIGLSLKINSKVLKAIEEGDEAHLPAKTFLRGFVLSYANFLHLDSEKVLEVFYEEMGSTKPKPYIRPTETDKASTPGGDVTTAKAPEGEASSAPSESPAEATVTPIRKTTPAKGRSDLQSLQENKSPKTIAIFVVGVVLVGLIIFTKKMIDKYSKEAEVPSSQVAQTMENATPVTEPAAETVVEPTPPGATVAPSPLESLTKSPALPVPVTTPAPKETPATTPAKAEAKPSPTPTPAASPSPSPTATPVATASLTPTPKPTPKPEEGGKPVELIVEALDTVEIEYSAPNGKPQKIKLSAEQVHTFKSKSGLKINFSNGGAVNLILNGKEIGIPGDLGKPVKLSY